MLCYDGKISMYCYFGTALPFILLLVFSTKFNILFQFWNSFYWVPFLYYIIVNILIRLLWKGYSFQIAVRAAFLGFIFALGICIKLFASDNISIFGIYMCVMSIFHYSEFLSIAYIQPKIVSTDSFVINHSLQYTMAAVSSWLEFFIETYFFPGLKTIVWVSYIGLSICVVGEILRKAAMLTAHSNFNHLVQCEKADDHVLVSHGVYAWFRHPSYVGWFYWSIGTQIILLNPICIIVYTIASWYFFKQRITIEEVMLLNFFGQQYCDYQEKVGTGLPFIEGYRAGVGNAAPAGAMAPPIDF